MQIKNLFESAYYRRLILAYIIDEQGPISTVEIVGLLNWPKNTVKTNINGIRDMGIEVEYVGSRKTGGYQLHSWGPIKKSWVKQRYNEIIESLENFKAKE
ncbi:helix-turn-helix domain-containing protein [Pseudoalteromonas sp. 0303]|jgi:hypothetical protein|uniref:helix-turn-helix domain-containing protein n=1 Tax=Pseudoalteromonas TaxID=53246 RepID=UPI001581EFAE|nr:helix-turn-helix domain-containing protein [Pseudoalteromonas sp. 0303]